MTDFVLPDEAIEQARAHPGSATWCAARTSSDVYRSRPCRHLTAVRHATASSGPYEWAGARPAPGSA